MVISMAHLKSSLDHVTCGHVYNGLRAFVQSLYVRDSIDAHDKDSPFYSFLLAPCANCDDLQIRRKVGCPQFLRYIDCIRVLLTRGLVFKQL
jgi:hypothetical protein